MLDPNNPTTADSAIAIGIIVVALLTFYELIKCVEKTKRNKHNNFDETDLY